MEKWRSCVGTLLLLLSPALQERALSAVQHSANQSVGDFDPSVQSRGLDPAKDPSNAGDNLPASSVVIEAPKAGDTLVSSASVALRVRVEGGCGAACGVGVEGGGGANLGPGGGRGGIYFGVGWGSGRLAYYPLVAGILS